MTLTNFAQRYGLTVEKDEFDREMIQHRRGLYYQHGDKLLVGADFDDTGRLLAARKALEGLNCEIVVDEYSSLEAIFDPENFVQVRLVFEHFV